MKIVRKKLDLETALFLFRKEHKTIGFVPTMGALHQGHISLVKKAKQENDVVVVSIFINPTQFDNQEDLAKYPSTLTNDIELLKSATSDILFLPSANQMYPEKVVSKTFDFDGLENQMEGKFRKEHFNGVGTIVKTLFEVVKPTIAYFGEKDFQQLQIIKKMVEKQGFAVQIKGCLTYRATDGLAMSSRNSRLTPMQRKAAPFIFTILQKVNEKLKTTKLQELSRWVINQFEKQPLLRLEYFTIADEKMLRTAHNLDENKKYRAFIAVYAGDIRLIDNIALICPAK